MGVKEHGKLMRTVRCETIGNSNNTRHCHNDDNSRGFIVVSPKSQLDGWKIYVNDKRKYLWIVDEFLLCVLARYFWANIVREAGAVGPFPSIGCLCNSPVEKGQCLFRGSTQGERKRISFCCSLSSLPAFYSPARFDQIYLIYNGRVVVLGSRQVAKAAFEWYCRRAEAIQRA